MIVAVRPGDDDEPQIDQRANEPRDTELNIGKSIHDPELASLKQMTRKVGESKNELQPGSIAEMKALGTVRVKSKSKPDPQKVKLLKKLVIWLVERLFGQHPSQRHKWQTIHLL